MKTRSTNIAGRDKLYNALDAYCRTINKRSVNYTIEVYSEYFASVSVQTVGKRATAQKKVILYYDSENKEWIAVCNGIEYTLNSLSEITTLLKQQITKLNSWVNKF